MLESICLVLKFYVQLPIIKLATAVFVPGLKRRFILYFRYNSMFIWWKEVY